MTEDILRLITKVISNEATESEIEDLLEWVDKDNVNKLFFEEFKEVWNTTAEFESGNDVENGIHYLRQRISFSEEKKYTPIFPVNNRSKKMKWHYVKVAASILLIGVTAAFLYLNMNPAAVKYKTLVMPYGKKGSLHLSDGSTLEVNSGTKISFPEKFADDERLLKIEGEAFFEIAKDKNRPFIIEAGELEIQVLGTSFNLKSYKNDKILELGVKTGSVSISNKSSGDSTLSNIFYLEPGELISINVLDNTFKKQKVDIDLLTSWTKETLVFNDKNLSEVAIMLQRWYNIPVILENDLLNNCEFMGEYKNESLRNILEALKFSIGIEYLIKDNEVIINGKGCST